MPKMKAKEILSFADKLLSEIDDSQDFETPLDYYLGNPRGDEVEGRSKVISTDVADSVEWIMPQVMRSFTQNNEIVIFDPISKDDDFQSKLESQYVYEVLMKENDGFIILYQFVKDALLQKNGYLKVWCQESTEENVQILTGISPPQYQAFLADPTLEVNIKKEHSQINQQGQPIPIYDVSLKKIEVQKRIKVESVPPEDIRVNKDHNSINLQDAKFVAHLMVKTISELREEGVKESIITKLLNSEESDTNRSEYRFQAQGENTLSSDWDEEALTEIDIAEIYTFLDINDDGIAERVKLTVSGHTTADHLIDYEEIDYSPWVSTSPILMPHKLHGLSIYDRLREIQDQKTSLLRNTFDNIYLQNNQRHLVVENQVKMSDLMVSRPGGAIRVKNIDAIKPLITPNVGQDAFNMMSYLDQVRAGRAGVSPEGELQQHKIGERVGSQGLERLISAKEELVGLIVRVIAETGVKPLCLKIRELCTKHIDAIRDFHFRGQWIKVDPSHWPFRMRSTVRVGTGTGNHERQLMAIRELLQTQMTINGQPGQTIVNWQSIFNTLDDFCSFSGLNSAVGYFYDPSSPEGKQLAQQVQQQMQQQSEQAQQQMMAQLKFQQQLAQAEQEKAIAQSKAANYRAQADKANGLLTLSKAQNEFSIAMMKQELEEAKALAKESIDRDRLELERNRLVATTGLEITKLEMEQKSQEDERYRENVRTAAAANNGGGQKVAPSE